MILAILYIWGQLYKQMYPRIENLTKEFLRGKNVIGMLNSVQIKNKNIVLYGSETCTLKRR